MRRADFSLVLRAAAGDRMGGCGVVQGHVCFYFFGIGAGGRFPAGFLGGRVEVVGEVFGVGVADFPGRGQAGFLSGLRGEGEVSECREEGMLGEVSGPLPFWFERVDELIEELE